MLFTAPSDVLQAELSMIARIHSGDLIVRAKQNRVTFAVTGPDYRYESWFPASVIISGSFQVSSTRLASYFKTAKEGEYTFSLIEDRLTITSPSTKLVLHVMPKPHIAPAPVTATLLGSFDLTTVRNLLSSVSIAIGSDPTRPAYSGIFLQIQPDRLSAIAMDGARMAIVEVGALNEGSGVVFLTKSGYRKVVNLFSGARGVVSIYKSNEGSRYWLTDHRRILYVEGSATLPDYSALTTGAFEYKIMFKAADLRAAIDRLVKPDGRVTTVVLTLNAEGIEVCADGACQKLSSVERDGLPVVLAFNSRYLMEFLRAADGPDLSLSFNDGTMVTRWEDARVSYFLMM